MSLSRWLKEWAWEKVDGKGRKGPCDEMGEDEMASDEMR